MARPARVIVYMATNRVNGKRYVGVTRQTLATRVSQHKYCSLRGQGFRLHAAIRKYGFDAFEFSILKRCFSIDEMFEEEIRFVSELKPEYNVTTGGDGVRGIYISEATRKLLSIAASGKPGTFLGKRHRPESIEKMRQASLGAAGHWLGKKRPGVGQRGAATRLQRGTVSRYWLGRPRPDETKEKISRTKKERGPPILTDMMAEARERNLEGARAASAIVRRRSVKCVDDGCIFRSAKEAEDAYGIDRRAINRVASGKRPTIRGLRFSYCDGAAA